jgi:hypothetical protein
MLDISIVQQELVRTLPIKYRGNRFVLSEWDTWKRPSKTNGQETTLRPPIPLLAVKYETLPALLRKD